MKNEPIKHRSQPSVRQPDGFVLLATMIVLVVLASLAAGLATQVSMAKRRQHYMIEYQRARYGVDSGMKYILSVLPEKNFILEERQEKPDFSDLFLMNRDEFAAFIADWAETATLEQIESILKEGASLTEEEPLSSEQMLTELTTLFGGSDDANEMPLTDLVSKDVEDANDMDADADESAEDYAVIELDPNDVAVPGPYGVPWPYVMEPIDLEIGPCKVTITVEDENAKMPLSWLITNSKEANEKAKDALETFCEWMSWDTDRLIELQSAIIKATEEIYKKKVFNLNPNPIILKQTPAQPPGKASPAARGRAAQRRSRGRTAQSAAAETRPAVAHTTDFAKLFHSSLLDQELLAQPLPDTGDRLESPLKYLSLWGAQRVNVNTAPRHVLEAAFTLAGVGAFDVPELTQKVIAVRKEAPLKSVDDLKSLGGLDAETMKNLSNYMTTTSTFFQIRVTGRSGNARTSAVATVVKEGNKAERLMILYE